MSKTKKSTTRGERKKERAPLTKQEALEMLESAIYYCQRAGLSIGGKNESGALVLTIPHAAYILTHGGTRAAFELTAETAPGEGLRTADAVN